MTQHGFKKYGLGIFAIPAAIVLWLLIALVFRGCA